jgi:microcystin-dependent protein
MGELRIMSFNFAPKGWAQCNGQFLPINQNQALFSLLGTQYGGNGQTTFALPDLRGRVPFHRVAGLDNVGQAGGEESHALSQNAMPVHMHAVNATNTAGDQVSPAGLVPANPGVNGYAAPGALVPLSPLTIGNTGGSQPHENRSPYLALNVCIALTGIFPSRN